MAKSIGEKWANLSPEERKEAVAETAPEVEARRAETKRGRKQLPKAISSDVEKTLSGIEGRVSYVSKSQTSILIKTSA